MIGRRIVLPLAASVLALTACQAKQTEVVDVDASGSVTVTDTGTAVLTAPARGFVFAKPDVATLRAQAHAYTRAYVGPGVGKPVVTMVKVGASTYVLTASQKFASAAALAKHYRAWDPASLDLKSSTDAATGVTTETLIIDKPDSDPGDVPPAVKLLHSGHNWSLTFTLDSKSFKAIKEGGAEIAAGIARTGAPASALTYELRVHLPGAVTSTNGTRLAHGVVSWNLLHLKSPVLTVSSKA